MTFTPETYVDSMDVTEARRYGEVRTNLGEPILDLKNIFGLGIE